MLNLLFSSQPTQFETRPVKHYLPIASQVVAKPKDVFKPTEQRPDDNFVEKMLSRVPTAVKKPSNFFEKMSITSGTPTNFIKPSGAKN